MGCAERSIACGAVDHLRGLQYVEYFGTETKELIRQVGCSNLGGVYGNQVFRANDRPLYVTPQRHR